MKIILYSTYELGRQPFNLAHPAAILKNAGFHVDTVDLALGRFDPALLADAALVAISIPMHTAARLTAPLLARIRDVRPKIPIAAFGLYAVTNRDYLQTLGVTKVLGKEFARELLALSRLLESGALPDSADNPAGLRSEPEFIVPERGTLPRLERYAHLQIPDGRSKTVGYVEASLGCKHLCRHCPVVPVYHGRFRAVPREIVLADIRQQVAAGARHITFGDPDFLNGPAHGRHLIEALHREFPELTYDVTIKVEHLLGHRDMIPRLKATGCLFVTSAIESVDNYVLTQLAKGHSREDFFELSQLLDAAGLDLSPTFIPFTPWTTLESYLDLLRVVAELGLIEAVAPVQLAIRLLIPPGSLLLDLDEIQSRIQPLEADAFRYPWSSSDPRLDRLQLEVETLAQAAGKRSRMEIFSAIWALAHTTAGLVVPPIPQAPPRTAPAQLSEPWYCCAEPTPNQYRFL